MAIEKIKRLKLIAVKSEREALFKELITLGCVQILVPEVEPADSEKAKSFVKKTAGLNECKTEYETLSQGIKLLDKYVPEKTGLFKRKPEVSKQTILDESSLPDTIEFSNKIRSTDGQVEQIASEDRIIKGLLETFKPWSSLDIPFGLSETETCFILPGVLPASIKLTYVEKALSTEESESQIIKVMSDREAHYILLVAMKENRQAVLEIVQRYGFVPLSVGNMAGTAGENIAVLKKRIFELESEKRELIAAIKAMAASRYELKLCADRMLTKADMAENAEKLLYTDYTINFEGWIPAREEKKLVSVLSSFDCAWEILEPTMEEAAIAPFKLGRSLFFNLNKRKLYRAGGKQFRPLAIKTSYVNIVKAN